VIPLPAESEILIDEFSGLPDSEYLIVAIRIAFEHYQSNPIFLICQRFVNQFHYK